MAALNKVASYFADEIRDGIAWVIIWYVMVRLYLHGWEKACHLCMYSTRGYGWNMLYYWQTECDMLSVMGKEDCAMERLTKKEGDNYVLSPELYTVAVQRLGKMEDMLEQLLAEKDEIASQLEAQRNAGKEKSVRFRELFARKLTVMNTLDLCRRYGLL